ncbi:MAG: signal recognition particle subunit SRP19/SEC65 family protein [Promethearchaeota archaeon]
MRTRKPFLIFWPQYFEKRRTRKEGRRLPQNLALDKVSLADIAKAAKRLGYKVEMDNVSRYPRTWWDAPGRVLIDPKGKKKSRVIKEIAKELRKTS